MRKFLSITFLVAVFSLLLCPVAFSQNVAAQFGPVVGGAGVSGATGTGTDFVSGFDLSSISGWITGISGIINSFIGMLTGSPNFHWLQRNLAMALANFMRPIFKMIIPIICLVIIPVPFFTTLVIAVIMSILMVLQGFFDGMFALTRTLPSQAGSTPFMITV